MAILFTREAYRLTNTALSSQEEKHLHADYVSKYEIISTVELIATKQTPIQPYTMQKVSVISKRREIVRWEQDIQLARIDQKMFANEVMKILK